MNKGAATSTAMSPTFHFFMASPNDQAQPRRDARSALRKCDAEGEHRRLERRVRWPFHRTTIAAGASAARNMANARSQNSPRLKFRKTSSGSRPRRRTKRRNAGTISSVWMSGATNAVAVRRSVWPEKYRAKPAQLSPNVTATNEYARGVQKTRLAAGGNSADSNGRTQTNPTADLTPSISILAT